MVDFPELRHRPVHALVEAAFDEVAGEFGVARHLAPGIADIARPALDRARETVEQPHAEGRHVVDEELVDMLGGDDETDIGSGLAKRRGEPGVAGVESGDLGRVAGIPRIHDMGKMRGRESQAKLSHARPPRRR